jgi:hypothetical protein
MNKDETIKKSIIKNEEDVIQNNDEGFRKPKSLKRKKETQEFDKISLKKFMFNFEKVIQENTENRIKYSSEPVK